MTVHDHELMKLIGSGDESALASLYDRYAGMLLALAYRILRDRGEAEDVVLESLERAWRESGRYDPARGSVRSWLAVMVRSRALDRARARRRHADAAERAAYDASVAHIGSVTSAGNPASAAEQDETQRLVRGALASLTDVQREAIELAYYGGLSQSQIADRLDTPLGTIKTRIRDGMQKLRAALAPLGVSGQS